MIIAQLMFALGLMTSSVTQQTASSCPSASDLNSILQLRDVYIGEVHGNSETPALVGCLVKEAILEKGTPLTVSLELPARARDPNSAYWGGTDGRASQATWELVQYLLSLEAAKHIALHFQENDSGRSPDFDKTNGEALREIASHTRLIALGGNYHAQRAVLNGKPSNSAGNFVGPEVKLIRIEAVDGGTSWICQATPPCGVSNVPKSPVDGAAIGHLVDGASYGYDKIYFIKSYTASRPHIGNGPVHVPVTKEQAAQLRVQLESMLDSDQRYRRAASGENQAQLALSFKKNLQLQAAVDQSNLVTLNSIVMKYGWPWRRDVGTKASQCAFLILQHAGLNDQERLLPDLEQAVKVHEADGQYLGMLRDRILIRRGLRQIYGTQVRINPVTSMREISPVEDIGGLDKRRSELGMPPMAEYMKALEVKNIAKE